MDLVASIEIFLFAIFGIFARLLGSIGNARGQVIVVSELLPMLSLRIVVHLWLAAVPSSSQEFVHPSEYVFYATLSYATLHYLRYATLRYATRRFATLR